MSMLRKDRRDAFVDAPETLAPMTGLAPQNVSQGDAAELSALSRSTVLSLIISISSS